MSTILIKKIDKERILLGERKKANGEGGPADQPKHHNKNKEQKNN